MASVVVLSLEMRFYSAFIGCPKLCLSTHTRLLHDNTAETLLSDDRRHNTMTDMTWAADGERIELKVVCQHGSIMSLIPCRRSRAPIPLLLVLCLVTVQVTSLQHGEKCECSSSRRQESHFPQSTSGPASQPAWGGKAKARYDTGGDSVCFLCRRRWWSWFYLLLLCVHVCDMSAITIKCRKFLRWKFLPSLRKCVLRGGAGENPIYAFVHMISSSLHLSG